MRITKWDELQAMTPEQRRQHFRQAVVLDPAADPDPVIRDMFADAQAWAAQHAVQPRAGEAESA